MQKINSSFCIGPVLSGILTFVAMCEINWFCSWFCYIPLFISIANTSHKIAFQKGLVFGATIAFLAFSWMVRGAERFTGYSMWYGLAVMLVSLLFLALYHGALLWIYSFLKKESGNGYSILANACLMAAIVCSGEYLLSFVSEGFPWFDEHSGSGLAENLLSIQPAAIFGIHILSFAVVKVNYLAAVFIMQKKYRKLYVPAACLLVYMAAGFILLKAFVVPAAKPFTVAILAENIPPEISWNDSNGNELAQGLVDLNVAAAKLQPNLILWSESGIPWTYEPNDPLIKEVLRVTAPAQATHIMGINTAYREKEIFNSAYCLLPNGQMTSRYDKQHLLALIERPVEGLHIPFFSSSGYFAKTGSHYAAPLKTPHGKAGIMICNESAVPSAAANMVKQGAQFMLNMSNDGWFNDTYIVRDHYFTARLRAVESRKDLVINSNNGYSGLIKASGEIMLMRRSTEPFTEVVSVQPNSYVTMAARLPQLFVYGCAAYIFLIALLRFKKRIPS